MSRKRGPYFDYLNFNDNRLDAKMPRQTEWNRRKKV